MWLLRLHFPVAPPSDIQTSSARRRATTIRFVDSLVFWHVEIVGLYLHFRCQPINVIIHIPAHALIDLLPENNKAVYLILVGIVQ